MFTLLKKRLPLLRYLGILLCILILFYTIQHLQSTVEKEVTWGYETLFMELSFWGLVLLNLGQYISKHPKRLALLGASSLSGILLGISFMPSPLFFLNFIGFVPLLWAEHELAQSRKGTSLWTVFKLSFNSFLLWNIISTFWVLNTALAAGIVANVANALLMTIPFLLYHWIKQHQSPKWATVAFVSSFISFELAHLNWDLSWPWLTLGNSFAHLPFFIQWYEYTGVFGGSLWVLGINGFIAHSYFYKKTAFQPWLKTTALQAGLGILIPMGISLIIYTTYSEGDASSSINVVSLQPNYEPHYEKFNTPAHVQVEKLLQLASSSVSDSTDLLLFPETSFRNVNPLNPKKHHAIQRIRSFSNNFPQLDIVGGISGMRLLEEEEAARTKEKISFCDSYNGQQQCRHYQSTNTAIHINANWDDIPIYHKSKLVPGAEFLPDFLNTMILDLGGAQGFSLTTQKERLVFSGEKAKIAPVICYESIYGAYCTEYAKKGAELFVVLTNDGWWGNTPGHRQHMYMSSLRAIENRRAVVRSANTGISCFINSRGDIFSQTNYEEDAALKGKVRLQRKVTFYSIYTNLIARIAVLVTIFLLITSINNLIQKRKSSE